MAHSLTAKMLPRVLPLHAWHAWVRGGSKRERAGWMGWDGQVDGRAYQLLCWRGEWLIGCVHGKLVGWLGC